MINFFLFVFHVAKFSCVRLCIKIKIFVCFDKVFYVIKFVMCVSVLFLEFFEEKRMVTGLHVLLFPVVLTTTARAGLLLLVLGRCQFQEILTLQFS